jgi:hypothetical protein
LQIRRPSCFGFVLVFKPWFFIFQRTHHAWMNIQSCLQGRWSSSIRSGPMWVSTIWVIFLVPLAIPFLFFLRKVHFFYSWKTWIFKFRLYFWYGIHY